MLKKTFFMILVPLGVLGYVSAEETDVSGDERRRSTPCSPRESRRVSKQAMDQDPFEQKRSAVASAISSLGIEDEESILPYFSEIPRHLLGVFTKDLGAFAVKIRELTGRSYEETIKNVSRELSCLFLRFQERPRILESIVHESATQFSGRLNLKVSGASSPKKVSKKTKADVISPGFFPKFFADITRSILDRDQTIPGISEKRWNEDFTDFYDKENREMILEGSKEVNIQDRPWYEHMTAVTPNPDLEFFELLGGTSDRSKVWVRKMVKSYSSDRMPLNSLKMTKYFLKSPEELQVHIEKVFDTFFSEDFEKSKDSQGRIVHLFMENSKGPKVSYISHFVNIMGFLGDKFKGELVVRFVEKLTAPGWEYVEKKIQRSRDLPEFNSMVFDLDTLFFVGREEAQRTASV